MPVVVLTPVQGDTIGPGTFVRAETQSVLPVGHRWRALVFPAGGQDFNITASNDTQGQFTEMELGVQVVGGAKSALPITAQPAITDAGEYELHVQVLNADSTAIVDSSGPIGIRWAPDAWGTAYVQTLRAQGGVGTGGYTDADRAVASSTLQSVQATFASGIAGVPDVIAGIGQMFTSPPVEILRRAELLVLEGRGQLQYPAGGLEVQAYGALVGFDHLPPGIGFRDGFIKEYEVRVGQFVIYGRHGNTQLYVKFLEDLNSVGQYIIWGGPFPRTIGYDVTPGIRLTWQWLVLGVQP